MRAVNLIPADARVGGGPTAGRSGGAVYALLGALTVLVVMVAVWATTSGKVDDQKAELAQVQQEVAQVQARASALQSPGAIQQERMTRTATVIALATQRTDWAERLDAISRTLPADVTLTALDAKSSAEATAATPVGGAAGTPAAGPAVQLQGCAPSQRDVARLMPRLRSVPGVVGVTLLSSTTVQGGGASGTTTEECGGATFSMALSYAGAAPAAGVTPGTTPDTAAAPATATTAVAGTPDPTTGGTQ